MKLIIVFTLLAVLLHQGVKAQLPACNVTSCTTASDCPKFNAFDRVVACENGTCVSSRITILGIGEECEVESTTTRCMNGLVCANLVSDGVSVCQTSRSYGCACETREECDGLLCLNGTCDAIRSIGDACNVDDHCGSVCSGGVCIAGPVGAKCNADRSCNSSYCDQSDFTCKTDTRALCSSMNPFGGRCDDRNALCNNGVCYSRNGDIGDKCSNDSPFPPCKVSLACIDGMCNIVAEGSPCNSSNDCNRLQSCVCEQSSNGASNYGCFTTQGVECTVTYQELDDCLNSCSELHSEGISGTCANKCSSLRSAYECCISCENDSPILKIHPVDCCSSSLACTTMTCTGSSDAPTTSPTPTPTSVPPGSTTNVGDDPSNTSVASQSLPYLVLAGLLVMFSVILS